MIEITETEALNRVAAYCSTAEHCRAEIAEKLQRWGIAYDAIDRIINRLEQTKLPKVPSSRHLAPCPSFLFP